jgi:formate dehydrogenase maturation protein FdhE
MGNQSGKKNNTVVVHHHHNHNSKPNNGQTRRCPICGATGRLSVTGKTLFGATKLHCGYCGGDFTL